MSFTADPLYLIFALLPGGALLVLSAAWNLWRSPHPRGLQLIPRLVFSSLLLAVGLGAIWTGLYQVSRGEGDAPRSLPRLADFPPPEAQAAPEIIAGLTFHRDVAFARAESRRSGRPLFIDFYAVWCDPCHRWEAELARDSRLNAALGRTVLAKIKDTDPAFDAFQEHPAHHGLRVGLPYFVLIDAAGDIRYQSNDYRDTRGMIEAIEAAMSPAVRAADARG